MAPPALALATSPRLARGPAPLRVGMLALGGLGGSSRVACELARGLAEEGHDTCVLSSPDPWWSIEPSDPAPLVPVPVPREPGPALPQWVDPLADALAEAVQDRGLQLLSVHYGVGLAAAAVLAKRRLRRRGVSLRVCATLHGTDVTHWARCPVQGPALSAALRACDEVTAVSGWLAERAHRALALPRRPRIIANGVDTRLFRPAPRPPASRPPVLCHASNFRPVKRPLDAIDVLARVRDQGVPASLWMVGDGPLRARAVEHARGQGVSDHVRFLPPMAPSRLAELLRTVSLSLVTSASESFSLFGLESMASGIPVVGTRCGGLPEVLGVDRSGELSTALLADVGDVDALASRAVAALSDPDAMQRLRRRALALAHGAFPRRRQLQRFAAVLHRVAAEDAA